MTITASARTAEVAGTTTRPTRNLASLAAVIGMISAVLSAAGSWIPSLWGDEAASVISATRSVDSLSTMLAHVDAVHGAYYFALHAWVGLMGSSPFAVRLPSAVAIGCCAAALTWLCGRFGSVRLAALAGGFAAVLPRLTYAGAEARSSAFAAALAAVLCVLLGEMVVRDRVARRWWVAYACVLALGIYTFFYLGLMIVVAGAVVATTPHLRREWRRWAAASAAGILVACPVIVFALLERHQVAFLAHRDVVNPSSVLMQMWFGAWPVAVIAWILIVVAVLGWIRDEFRRRRGGRAWKPRLETIAAPWLLLPVGILLASSPLVAGYSARYGTFAAPAAAALMAVGVWRLRRIRWAAASVVIAVVVAIAPVWVAQRAPYAKNGSDWAEIAAVVREQATAGDAIVFDEGVRPSRRPRLAMNTDPTSFGNVNDATLKTAATDGVSWHDTAYTPAQAAALGRFTAVERVWVVEYATPLGADTWGISDLEALGYRRVTSVSTHRSEISLFTR